MEKTITQNKRVSSKRLLMSNWLNELLFSTGNAISGIYDSLGFLIFANFVLSLSFIFLSSVMGFGLAIANRLQ